MGLDLDDITYGNDCGVCFPAGKTPKYLYASIGGMSYINTAAPAGPKPPNGICKLTQTIDPCTWYYDGSNFTVGFSVQPGTLSSAGIFLKAPAGQCFAGTIFTPCIYIIPNQLNPPYVYEGGVIHISWIPPTTPEGMKDLADDFLVDIDEETKAEFFTADDGTVYRYANPAENINIKIKKEP